MKLVLASDLHGSVLYTGQLMKRIEAEAPDRVLLLGDLLYHGPRNDLPEGYAPKQVIPMLNGIKEKIVAVRGNCEAEVDQMVLEFPVMAEYTTLALENGKLLFATHGHHYNTACPPPLAKGDILLHGHTHVPAWQEFGSGNLYLNPGSVAIPKENSAHSYMMLTDSGFAWKDLEGSIYHTLALDCPNCG